MALVEGRVQADAVFIATCFRCAEAAIVSNELRRYIHENSRSGRQLLVYREDDFGDSSHQDGGTYHYCAAEGPARQGGPGRTDAWG